jgi:hypothetical protein
MTSTSNMVNMRGFIIHLLAERLRIASIWRHTTTVQSALPICWLTTTYPILINWERKTKKPGVAQIVIL